MTHLPLSGVLDARTLHQMALPRCGTDDGASPARRRRRTAQHGQCSPAPAGLWGLGSGLLGSPVLDSWGSCCGWEVQPHWHSIQLRLRLEVIFKAVLFLVGLCGSMSAVIRDVSPTRGGIYLSGVVLLLLWEAGRSQRALRSPWPHTQLCWHDLQ